MKYRRRAIVVDAVRFEGSGADVVCFIGGTEGDAYILRSHDRIGVRQPWGFAWVQRGDWVVRSDGGELQTLTQEAFEAMYEPLPDLGVVPRGDE